LYPLFPPAIGEVNMDLKHITSLELKSTPDVLLLSYKLKYFTKIVDQVVCINPEPCGRNICQNDHSSVSTELRARD
ncbi:2289_t:CDS:2, partial [Cetraspora pellucida]